MRVPLLILVGLLSAGCGDRRPVSPEDSRPEAPSASGFGDTNAERITVPVADPASNSESTYWVNVNQSSQYSSPGGAVVNRVYFGQRITVHERRGEWLRTTADGFDERWTRASDLTSERPAERPDYDGPAEFRDARIAPDAIANPGQYGLTRADIDIIRKGAKLVLQSRPDCDQIEDSDKSGSRANTYFVTCRMGGRTENVFFTRAEVEAANLR